MIREILLTIGFLLPSQSAAASPGTPAGGLARHVQEDGARTEDFAEVVSFREASDRATSLHEEGRKKAVASYREDLEKARPGARNSGDLAEVNLIDEQLMAEDDELLGSVLVFKNRRASKARQKFDQSLAELTKAFGEAAEKARDRAIAALEKRVKSALLENNVPLANALQAAIDELDALYIAPPLPPKPGEFLESFDSEINVFRGPWERRRDGSLRTNQTSSPAVAPILTFPITEATPRQFVVDLEFEVEELGSDSMISLLVPVGGREFMWNLGYGNNSTGQLVLEPGNTPYFSPRRPFFEAGTSYRFRVRVSDTEMTLFQGDQALYTFILGKVGARGYPDFPSGALCLRSCNAITVRVFRLQPLRR